MKSWRWVSVYKPVDGRGFSDVREPGQNLQTDARVVSFRPQRKTLQKGAVTTETMKIQEDRPTGKFQSRPEHNLWDNCHPTGPELNRDLTYMTQDQMCHKHSLPHFKNLTPAISIELNNLQYFIKTKIHPAMLLFLSCNKMAINWSKITINTSELKFSVV